MHYTRKIFMSGSMIGPDSKLSPIGALQLHQDLIAECFGSYEMDGFTLQRKYGATWVFTKNRIQFIKDIRWSNILTAEVYVTAVSFVILNADVLFYNEQGDLVLHTKLETCLLDVPNNKIKRISEIGLTKEAVELVNEKLEFEKLLLEDGETVHKHLVRSSSVDFIHHTNNVEYARFIIDAYSYQDLINRPIKELEIHYINQSHEGDELLIKRVEEENAHVYVIKNGDTIVCKAKLTF